MLIQFYYPEKTLTKDLDLYLSKGWFRNSVMLHNSKVICLDRKISSILNIRAPLDSYYPSKSLRKILKKNNTQFSFLITEVHITKEKQTLYKQHLSKFKGFLFENLEQFLYANTNMNNFNTYELNIYDGDKLVAFSFFDIGEKSMASLIAVYDQSYNSFSLGIYSMLLEVEFAKENNIEYYYPGYILDNSAEFDYKLRLGNIQYLNSNGKWGTKDQLLEEDFPGRIIEKRLTELEELLAKHHLPYQFLYNPYYTIGYIQVYSNKFTKSCAVFHLDAGLDNSFIQLEFNFEENKFVVSECCYEELFQDMIDMKVTDELKNSSFYQPGLVSYLNILYKNVSAKDCINFVLKIL